jgi:2,6-dihydroxypyridine 3-monooxygenase
VLDIEVPRMAFGRVCLIGDAAFAARPHAAAGTAKAAADAWALADALRDAAGDVVPALEKWEPGRLEVGRNLLKRVREMGRHYQVDSDADPADRNLRFGLYGPDH